VVDQNQEEIEVEDSRHAGERHGAGKTRACPASGGTDPSARLETRENSGTSGDTGKKETLAPLRQHRPEAARLGETGRATAARCGKNGNTDGGGARQRLRKNTRPEKNSQPRRLSTSGGGGADAAESGSVNRKEKPRASLAAPNPNARRKGYPGGCTRLNELRDWAGLYSVTGTPAENRVDQNQNQHQTMKSSNTKIEQTRKNEDITQDVKIEIFH
jgi:hypothetical protein